MKKTKPKLTLPRETIVHLTAEQLARAGGGFIMKDTIIIKTSG